MPEAGRVVDDRRLLLRGMDPANNTLTQFATVTSGGLLSSIGYHWNTSTLAYEVNTGGTTAGGDVNVTNFPASQAVTGPLTDTQLRATAVPVSSTTLATSALQTSGNASLTSIDGKTPALGQAVAASSSPVVLTAAQMTTLTPLSTLTAVTSITNPVAVTGTFWQTTQPVSDSANIALVGDVGSKPAANTVLDRLYQIGLKVDNNTKLGATEATLAKLVAALTTKPAVTTTLLHGR